jgi:adenosine deaminase
MSEQTLPSIDLHRHLDLCVRLETILDLARKHNLPLPAWDVESLRPHIQFVDSEDGTAAVPGLLAYFARLKWMISIFADYDACRRVAYENVEDAREEGIRYLELRFSPWFMAEPHSLDPAGIAEAVVDGAEAGARDFGVKVKLIGIISRTYGPKTGWREMEALLQVRDHLTALDLAGDETNWPGELFVDHFERGRDAGWQITVHAGEAGGPENIWQAIDELGASRIGHGVAAQEDLALQDALIERQIGIESCLTSNVHSMTVPDYASHPLKQFLSRGLLATINTDNTGVGAVDLPHELRVAAPAANLSKEQIAQAQRNALTIAFLSDEERAALRS